MIWPLVGRERELGNVAELLSGGAAGGLVLAGAAGVGKTRLAGEAARLAKSRGCAVEWVRATRSAGSIPFGAFAGLLSPGLPGGAELLALVRGALAERAARRRLVLCVDDAHLLDHGSAALVHQLVAAGEAFAVVTVTGDEPAPDAVRALWKDELCAYVELGTLERPEVERLLAEVLGGPVDGRSASALWELTRGNVLYLRELVLFGSERGTLAEDGGIWRWSGEVAAGMRLADLVDSRLGRLAETERAVLELVAVGAPLDAALLDRDETAALEALERREIVELRLDGRRRLADVAHPLHGEVIRAQLAWTRQEAVQRRLADAVEAAGALRRADVVRLADWRLHSGGGDHELFERAAAQAMAARDPVSALRFADAALQAGGGFEALLTRGRALAGGGRPEEAHAALAELVPGDDGERAGLATAIARNSFFGLGRVDEADAVLREAAEAVADQGLRDELAGLRVRLQSGRGRPLEALEVAMPLLEDPGVREQGRLHAAVAAGESLATSGRGDESLALIETWAPVAARHRDELPVVALVLLSMRGLALRLLGRPVEASASSAGIYERALAYGSSMPVAVEASLLGWSWLARGRVRTALRWFRESATLLRGVDVVAMLPWALGGVASAAAQAGEAEIAREAVEEMDGTTPSYPSWEPELGLARAWSAAAVGELSRARALALEAADLAGSGGQAAFELRALHELCRLGDPAAAAPRLERLGGAGDSRPPTGTTAAQVDGPFAPLAAAHAAALVARDADALLAAGERFAELDMLLVAVEAADAAAAAYLDGGREASARTAAARAAQWLQGCEGARPPTLLGDLAASELTAREREIALLAAGGLSSREIADRLVVSVRTVDNHLQRAYRKLGIARREDLPQVL